MVVSKTSHFGTVLGGNAFRSIANEMCAARVNLAVTADGYATKYNSPMTNAGSAPSSLCIIGTTHQDSICDAEIAKHVRMAANGDLVVFLEGYSANPKKAMSLAQQIYCINDGLCFGCESEVAHMLSASLLRLGYNRAKGMQDDARVGNLQTIYDLRVGEDIKEAWDKVPASLRLRREVDAIIEGLDVHDLKKNINEIYSKHQDVLTSPEWVQVYPYLFKALKERIPANMQAPLNDPRIPIYLESKENVGQEYVVNEINNKWRNTFIVHNIAEQVKSNHLEGKDVYVFIGSMHINQIAKPLSDALGVPARVSVFQKGKFYDRPSNKFETGHADYV